MSLKSENSSNSSHLLPWMVNKLLAKTRRNRNDQNYHDLEERTPNFGIPDSSNRALPLVEHRRDKDGGNALRISMNTDLPERIKKISPPTTSTARKPIATYVPTGAERTVGVERKRKVDDARSAKNTLQRPLRTEVPTHGRELRSVDITERKPFSSSKNLSPPRNLRTTNVPRQAEKPGWAYSSKAPIPPAAEPSFTIPRKPRHVPRLASIDEKSYPNTSPTQYTAADESPRGSHRSNDATEWGFLNPEGTSFLHSASNSEYSETSDSREGQNVRDVHDDRDGLSDGYIDRILAINGAIGRGAVRSESEYSQATDDHRNKKISHLPGRDRGIGLGLYEDRSESEYSHSEDEQPVEDKRWEPVMTVASESVYPEDEGVRLERWKQYFNPPSPRSLFDEAVSDEQDLLFEQLLKEVQVDIKEPGYRSEASKRTWWADFRKGLKVDGDEVIKVQEATPTSVPELSPDLSSKKRRCGAREQHDNRRVTMYQATKQRNTERNEARDTIGGEADLWELDTLLRNLQKKRNRRRGGQRGKSYEHDAGGDEVVMEEMTSPRD